MCDEITWTTLCDFYDIDKRFFASDYIRDEISCCAFSYFELYLWEYVMCDMSVMHVMFVMYVMFWVVSYYKVSYYKVRCVKLLQKERKYYHWFWMFRCDVDLWHLLRSCLKKEIKIISVQLLTTMQKYLTYHRLIPLRLA